MRNTSFAGTTTSILFRLMYALHFTPWDQDKPPRELVELVAGPGALPAGRALDLGCGTGVQSVYLASLGWEVTGVDIVASALRRARERARHEHQEVRFIEGDVTRLDTLHIGDGHSLIIDSGCLHTISHDRRNAFAEGVQAAAASDATFLSMGFQPGGHGFRPPGIDTEELLRLLPGWTLTWEHAMEDAARAGPMKNAGPTWRCLRRG